MIAGTFKAHPLFAADERGTVAVTFGLMFLTLSFVSGMAIDYGRVIHAQSNFMAAADAAALSGGRALLNGTNTEDDVKAIALKFFEANIAEGGGVGATHDTPVIDVDKVSGGVTVSVTAKVPMTLTAIAGIEFINVPVTASTKVDHKDIELGLALDITGSMKGQKLKDLKAAAKDLVDILMPDDGGTNKVRIGLAPYSAAVNVGTYAAAVSGNASIDGCVWERTGADAYTDAAPAAGSYFHAGAVPKDIDPTEGTSSYLCPKAKLQPLSNDKNLLKSKIGSLVADGFTAGHLGASWAWNLISPEWKDVWPAESKPVGYGDGKTLKVIILMTDGIFNTAYANGTSSAQALALCSKMKGTDVDPDLTPGQHKVVVYAIGFKAPAGAEATLKSCASSDDHYFAASNGSELKDAFSSIALQLSNLRLTN